MTHTEYIDWLASQPKPGTSIEYHRGFLFEDACPEQSKLGDKDRLALLKLRKTAWSSAEDGYVHLVQRRHGDKDYSYLAVAA